MKSKLFGNSAKMALAALVTCASLTSCYDLDGGSAIIIPEPTPQTVSYVLTEGATVKFAAGEVKTDAKGNYETSAQSTPFNTDVTFSAEGYQDLVANPGQGTATSGIATKVFNVELTTTGHHDHDHDHDHESDHTGGGGAGDTTGGGQ